MSFTKLSRVFPRKKQGLCHSRTPDALAFDFRNTNLRQPDYPDC